MLGICETISHHVIVRCERVERPIGYFRHAVLAVVTLVLFAGTSAEAIDEESHEAGASERAAPLVVE